MSRMTAYNWPVFRCPRLAGFGCPPRLGASSRLEALFDRMGSAAGLIYLNEEDGNGKVQ